MVYLGKLTMLKEISNPNTRDLSTMKVSGGVVEKLVNIYSLEEFKEFIEQNANKRIMVVGGGTNTVFVSKNEDLVLVKLNLKKIAIKDNNIEADAGVDWDEFVQKYIELGGVGLEALSIIPGTVGAAPVQNIGAYGEEVSSFIQSVKVYDLETKEFRELTNAESEFSYRNSIFKREKNRYIILSVVFLIQKGKVKIPNYKDLINYFSMKGKVEDATELWKNTEVDIGSIQITQAEIRKAIIAIRGLKFPDVSTTPNCGSFFKNPVITQDVLKKVKEFFPEIPIYKTPEPDLVKIPIGYILERLGFKNFNPDYKKGNFGIYKNHSLIVTSNGNGNVEEFLEFIANIKQKVLETSKIELEEEVNLI